MMRHWVLILLPILGACAGSQEPYRSPIPTLSAEQLWQSNQDVRETRLLDLATARSPQVPIETRRVAEANLAQRSLATAITPKQIDNEMSAITARIQARQAHASAVKQDADLRTAQAGQADAICDARGRTAEATTFRRGLVNFDGYVAGAQVKQACLDAYRATGIVPAP